MEIKLRITVAIGAGLITGVMVIALMQFLNGLITSVTDQEAGFQTAELIGLIVYGVGSLTAGAVARLVSVHVPPFSATICGIILMLPGLVNLLMVEHPLWFAISSTLVYIPAA